MSVNPEHSHPGVSHSNVRLVLVDDRHQPTYIVRAKLAEKALLRAAEKLGLQANDMPGLYGLCVQAVRSAEAQHR